MKRTLTIILITAALCGTAHSQTTHLNTPVGIGTWTAYGDLHIHESSFTEPVPGVEPFLRDGAYPGDCYTTLRLTNAITTSSENNGFKIEQFNKEIRLQQLENADLGIYGYNGTGLVINSLGKIGLGAAPLSGKVLNVGGDTQIGGKLDVDGKVTGTYGEFSQSVLISGMVRVGNGFECSATGDVKAKSLKITLDGWSDFVFDDNYRLPSLKEVEQYISQHRHLPDIPSTKEVEQEGIDLGQMNAKLLQKVEELTLYIIDLQKQIDELKQQCNN